MIHPTSQYGDLRSALKELRPITARVNPLICETPLQTLKVRSYILLAHAALEEYLEELAISAARQACKQFKDNGQLSLALVGLISAGVLDEIAVGKARKKATQDLFNNIEAFVDEALTRFSLIVKDNHGIKRHNQISLLLPIGFDPEAVDAATLAALDSFGTKRGDIAHKAKISKVHTLSEVDSSLNTILTGLAAFDRAACSALQPAVPPAPQA